MTMTRFFCLAVIVATTSPPLLTQDQSPKNPAPNTNAPTGALASGYADLQKQGSGKLTAEIEKYLLQWNLKRGENPNGLWVSTGTASVQKRGGDQSWGENRRIAFAEAQLLAQCNLIKSVANKSAALTVREKMDDKSILEPSFSEDKGFEERMRGKLEQWSEALLDKELKGLGQFIAPKETIDSKRVLYLKKLISRTTQEAVGAVSGFYVLQSFEAVEDEDPNQIAVGVVLGRRPNSLGWISAIAKGGGAEGVPREAKGRSLRERFPYDPTLLHECFGVRVVADENGQTCLVSFGQSSPVILASMSREIKEQKLESAKEWANLDAWKNLTEFLNSTLATQTNTEEEQNASTTEVRGTLDGVPGTREEQITNLIMKKHEKATKWSQAMIRGAEVLFEWQGNHPQYGNPMVGCVLVWKPESAAAAGRYNDNGSVSPAGGFKVTPATPGVRRTGGEEPPPGGGGNSERTDREAPLESPESTRALRSASNTNRSPVDLDCDGIVASGSGADPQAATLQALENALRMGCGVAMNTDSQSESKTTSAVVDVRVGEACAEMRVAFNSDSINNRNIGMRTKGFVRGYRVISETPDQGGTGVRITICADIPKWDPRNPRPGEKPTLIVAPPSCRQPQYTLQGENVSASDLEQSLEAALGREIGDTSAFTVLERKRLAAILGEQKLITDGVTALKEHVKLGNLSSGDLLLHGELEDLSVTREEKHIQLTDRIVVSRSGRVTLNWRLNNVGSGEVVAQGVVNLALSDADLKSAPQSGAPLASWILSRAVPQLLPSLIARAAPLRIAAVVDSSVFLNRGSKSLTVGDEFRVYRQGAPLKDPATGAVIGTAERQVGIIKVDNTELAFSTARVISGNLGAEDVGAHCR